MYSKEQLDAIRSRGQNLLISAAAGSGKTSVLVERIIRRVCSVEEMAGIDRFLVVTFTNAAAAEMRSRITDALNDVLGDESFTEETLLRHVERQITLLNASSISTLHSFCQNLLRQYFYLIDLDPNFRVADETETELLKNDILEEMFEEGFSLGDPDLLSLAEHSGDEGEHGVLSSLILKVYEFSRSHPWPDEWLQDLTIEFNVPPDTDFGETVWAVVLKDKIRLDLDMAYIEFKALLEETKRINALSVYSETIFDDMESIDTLSSACKLNFAFLKDAFNRHKFSRLPAAGKEMDEYVKKSFQKKRDAGKKRITSLNENYFARDGRELVADLRLAAPTVQALANVVKNFAQRFAKVKADKGLADFSDLEHLALKILRHPSSTPANSVPSITARELGEKYEEIMVDEYQDINLLQETIIKLLTTPTRPNLFMVGDVKQSIYRFRMAEPGLFMQKYHSFRSHSENKDMLPTEKRIDLNQNFRSRSNILYGVNFIFGLIMTKRSGEMEYGEEEELKATFNYPPPDSPDVKILDGSFEFCLIDTGQKTAQPSANDDEFERHSIGDDEEELSGFEEESLLIAQKITGLINGGYNVYDKHLKNYRPLMFRDIVVLLRSVKGKAAVVLDTLRQKGVPVYAEIDSGYFKETEVSVMLSLLSIIDNPRQDIHLAATLRSPIVGLNTRALAAIRLNNPDGDLWDALLCFADDKTDEETCNKVNLFLKRHTAWRNFARRKDVGSLIDNIYQETGFYDYAGGMPGGALRQANLRSLYQRAGQYGKTDFRGLFRFLRFIGKIRESGSDLATARSLGENEDVVRVMSIHKSKGLEFPVVILADLGKNFNLQDTKSLMLCHKELGVGPYAVLSEAGLRYPTPARWAVSHKIEQETKAEELRILYVALTRAKEKLILIGSDKKLAQKCQNFAMLAKDVHLPDSLSGTEILKAKSYLDLLVFAIGAHPDGRPLFEYGDFSEKCEIPILSRHLSSFKVTIYQTGQFAPQDAKTKEFDKTWAAISQGIPLPGGDADWVDAILNWRYPYCHSVGKPAKLTVSEIKRRLEYLQDNNHVSAEHVHKNLPPADAVFSFNRPRFLQETTALTKVEYGTAVHALMQHLDFKGDLSLAGVRAQARRLVEKEILLSSQAEALDYDKIAAFFTGALGERLRGASKVWREIPFSLSLDAGLFYPELKNSDEKLFVQGVIDCIFLENGQAVLIDYKTDWAASPDELADKYAAQLGMYSMAVESILRLEVKEEYIYSFHLSSAIKLKSIG